MTTPTDHVIAARLAASSIRTDADYDAWADIYAHGETYLNLPDAEVAEIEAIATEGRKRVMRFTFPVMAG